MKKLMLVLVVLGISLQSFAGPKEKDVVGAWTYKVETDQGDLTGKIKIEKKEGKLVGEVYTNEGETFSFQKVEFRENNVLYMELDNGYEILEITLTIKGKAYEGTVGNEQGSFPMTGEKIE